MNAPAPIPLRPDVNAQREASIRSLVRGVLGVARRSRETGDRIADLIVRAVTEPTSPSDAQALGATAMALIAQLAPVNAASALLSAGLQVALGRNASLVLPSLSLPPSAWIGDLGGIPIFQGHSDAGVTLRPFKIGAGLAFSRELAEASGAEQVVRQLLSEAVSMTLDATLFSDDAGVVGLSPPGLLNGIAPLPSSGDLLGDFELVAEALGVVSGASRPIFVTSAGAAMRIALTAYNGPLVYASAAIDPGTVIGVVPGGLVSDLGVLRVERSSETTVHLSDMPATDLSGATPVLSLFQSDLLGVKLILPLSWVLRSAAAIAWTAGDATRRTRRRAAA
jgi:hypothetical protein